MIGEWTEKVKIISDNLKGTEVVTEEGEIVRLHKDAIGELAMEIVNYAEKLSRTDKNTLISEEKRKILKMKEEQDLFQKRILETYGSFYFNFYKRVKIEGQFLFRFIHLCSYMNYDNYLSDGRKLLKEDDLQDLMLLGKTEYYKTKKYFTDKELIFIDDKGFVLINSKFCKKGEIHKTKCIEVIRMFNEAIQELYKKSLPREHKKLSLLIEILPYINYKYNIVCSNPEECDIKLIKPIKMMELCDMLGYNKGNSSRLKKQLFSLRVNDEKVIGIFEVEDTKAILINPRVYYKANKEEGLNYLEALFRL